MASAACNCILLRKSFIATIFNGLKFLTGVYFSLVSTILGELKKNDLAKRYGIDQTWINFYASYCYTGPLGVLVFIFVAHRFGNRPSLIYVGFAFTLGFLLLATLGHTVNLIVSQIVAGLGISVMLSQGINYIGEITEGDSRTIFMISSSLCQVLGGFYHSALSAYAFPNDDVHEKWRNVVWLHFDLSMLIATLVVLYIPESPVWLANGRYYTHTPYFLIIKLLYF